VLYTLLPADEGKPDQQIADHLHLNATTIVRTRKRFVEGNLLPNVSRALASDKRNGI